MGVGASYQYMLPVLVCQTPLPAVYCHPEGAFCLENSDLLQLTQILDRLEKPAQSNLMQIGSGVPGTPVTPVTPYQIIGQYPVSNQMVAVVIQMEPIAMAQLHDSLRTLMCNEKTQNVRFLPANQQLKQNLRACAAKAFNDFRLQLPVAAFAELRIQTTCPTEEATPVATTQLLPATQTKIAKQLVAAGAVGLLGAAAWNYRDEVKAGVNAVKRKARDHLCRQFALKELISIITTLSHLQDALHESTDQKNIDALQSAIKELSGIAKFNYESV